MLEIPQWAAASNFRNGDEVVLRRGRWRGPLEGPGVPRIVAGFPAAAQRFINVPDENQYRGRLENHADRGDHIHGVPAAAGRIRVDAARHAENSREVQRVESQVEADHEQPEMPFTQLLAQHLAGGLRSEE